MLKASLLAALAVAVLLLVIPLPADARKKKSKAVSVGGDEDSIGCKACKRMVMALEQFVIPNFKDKMKGKDNKQFYIGTSSVAMAEEFSVVCNFDSIAYVRSIRPECEEILEEYEDPMLTVLIRHYRTPVFNFVGEMCYNASQKCPSWVNTTNSEKPSFRSHLRTEKKIPEKQQGFLRHIVAESWETEVMNPEHDVATYLWTGRDEVTKATTAAFLEAAKMLRNCSTVKLGTVDLGFNDLPPPHGDFMKEDFEGVALWKGSDHPHGLNADGVPSKHQPVYITKDFRTLGISSFDIVDFIFKSVGRVASFECIREVSNGISKEDLRRLQVREDAEL